MAKRDVHIIFRNLGENVAPDCAPGCNWQVEYHVDTRGFPSGLAWVLADAESSKTGKHAAKINRPEVKFVLVADDSRRQGIAKGIITVVTESSAAGI
jgi:hypothetical protein